MDTSKKIAITAIVISLIAAVIVVARPVKNVIQSVTNTPNNVGSVASPDFMSDYFGVGGVRVYKHRASLSTATTTLCAIQSPAATSTLLSAAIAFTTGTTSASRVRISWGAARSATTTVVATLDYAANVVTELVATNTPAFLTSSVVKPNSWINFTQSGGASGSSGTFSPVGVCNASFEALEIY